MHILHTTIDNKLAKSTARTEHVIQFSAQLSIVYSNHSIQTVHSLTGIITIPLTCRLCGKPRFIQRNTRNACFYACVVAFASLAFAACLLAYCFASLA